MSERSREMGTQVRRLRPGDEAVALRLFALMVSVLEESGAPDMPLDYCASLLRQESFLAFAAFAGDELVGGVTAHVLLMTRSCEREVMIYDLAVANDYQGQGVGRALIDHLLAYCRTIDIANVFVLAEGDDLDAQRFYRALGGTGSAAVMFSYVISDPAARHIALRAT
jgi:aminoglycoside 3-N-acetyltransferase I